MKAIPSFILYEESRSTPFPDFLHCETIRARSRIHEWHIRPHRHHGLYQFFWLEEGAVKASIDGACHDLQGPAGMAVPPLTPHGFDFEPNTKGWVLTVPTASLSRALAGDGRLLDFLARPVCTEGAAFSHAGTMAVLFSNLYFELANRMPGTLAALQGLLAQIAVGFARTAAHPNSEEPAEGAYLSLFRGFSDLLEEMHVQRKPVGDYADLLGVTGTHLNRVCKAVIGKTASTIVQERTILEAKRALTYTSMTVSEVSYMLGFVDPAHFSKFFNGKVGMPPSRFRQQAEEGGTLIG